MLHHCPHYILFGTWVIADNENIWNDISGDNALQYWTIKNIEAQHILVLLETAGKEDKMWRGFRVGLARCRQTVWWLQIPESYGDKQFSHAPFIPVSTSMRGKGFTTNLPQRGFVFICFYIFITLLTRSPSVEPWTDFLSSHWSSLQHFWQVYYLSLANHTLRRIRQISWTLGLEGILSNCSSAQSNILWIRPVNT